MDGGNYVPADAHVTWSKRLGDCKGKTALLLGLLTALGIDAEAVLVNTAGGYGLDTHLPMATLFNHVLVRARIGGKTYWMDGTRSGDRTLDGLRTPAFGWGLPLGGGSNVLVRMAPPPLEEPTSLANIRIDATGGLTVPAPVRDEIVTRSDEALATNAGLSNMPAQQRESALRNYWKERYDFIEPGATKVIFDAARAEHRMVMDGLATLDWNEGRY